MEWVAYIAEAAVHYLAYFDVQMMTLWSSVHISLYQESYYN